MKVLFIILAISLASCADKPDINPSQTIRLNNQQDITVVSFENHKYLIYDGYNSGSMCHSESCDCKKLKSK